MNYERRLLLAIGLSMGILILWSTISPAPAPKGIAAERRGAPELIAPPQNAEAAAEYRLGGYRFGIGSIHGGIRTLEFNGEPLLRDATPGLLELSLAGTAERVALSTRAEGDVLISEGVLPGTALRIRRKISWKRQKHENLLEASLELTNESDRPLETPLEWTIYKPLIALHEEEKRYIAGLALGHKKTLPLQLPVGQEKEFPERPRWVIAQGKSEAIIVGLSGLEGGMFHVEHPQGGQPSGSIRIPIRLDPNRQFVLDFPIYVGPMVLAELKKLGMEETLRFGAFSGITRWLLRFLNWSQGYFHSYGWAICFLSLAVWLPFSPLTFYGMRMSYQMSSKMAMVKPQEARIRKEHKSNPQKMQKELMGLYRKHGINPASGCFGCLPFLLTWPLYIALFEVLNRAPELRGARFFGIRDLALPDGLIRFPMPLPLLGSQLNLLPFLAAGATFLQQQAMQNPSLDLTQEQKVQQQTMKIFPLMFLFFFYNLPSGFMLYWVVNSLLMGGQQMLIARLSSK